MVSLWGTSKKDDNDEEREALSGENGENEEEDTRAPRASPRRSERRNREADERTRLLPRNDGYLDPDDPAVSPYNLWSVRALRYISILFLIISFLWWTLLLVSIFVSPPAMNTRGSGFFDFSYTTLTVGNLIIAILFFSVPSKFMEISSLIICFLLLVDMILILAVGGLRHEEGWVGIASIVWATFIALYNVITDRVVAWGKKEEEERLTGRQETRRSLREWCAVLTASIIMVVVIVVTILLTATLILRSRDASLEAEGERYSVDGDKYSVHLQCHGNETDATGRKVPTIMLEGGENPVEASLAPYFAELLANGSIPRYCAWDRPGLAFSDNAPSPMSAGMATRSLTEALALAGEKGPWIAVSAGIGSIYSRIFSSDHVKDVAALFLIDGLHEDLLRDVGSPGRGFKLWAEGIISPLGLQRLPAALFKGRTREDRVFGRSAYQGGKYIKAKLQENLVANSLTRNEVLQARNIQTETTRLVVVSSGIEVGRNREWESKQKDLTTLTDRLVGWDVVNRAPHEVWRTEEGRRVIRVRLEELVAGL